LLVAGTPSPSSVVCPQSLTPTARLFPYTTLFRSLGTVHFTSSDSAALLPADYAFTAADAGVHVFSVTLASAGTHSLGASDTVTKTSRALEWTLATSPAAVRTLLVTGIPSPIAAGD